MNVQMSYRTDHMEQAIEQEDKEKWKLDVLESMVVTWPVAHFEMSALNATAPVNAVGDVNAVAVAVEPQKKGKIVTQNC